jgi:hypothetical protein
MERPLPRKPRECVKKHNYKPGKKGNHKPFARKKSTELSLSSAPLKPSNSTGSSWTLYRDGRIELDRFIDVLYHKEYHRLIISGNPPDEVLKEAWDAIYLEYCELMADGTYNELLEKSKHVQLLNGRITLIDGIVKHLRLCFDQVLVDMLGTMAIPCDLSIDDPEPEFKLKKVLAWGKRFVVELDVARKDLEKAQAQKRQEQGDDYFDEWLMALSKAYGYAVKAKDITVTQFCRAIKKLNKEAEKQATHGN